MRRNVTRKASLAASRLAHELDYAALRQELMWLAAMLCLVHVPAGTLHQAGCTGHHGCA
jgi:hypothetical protein